MNRQKLEGKVAEILNDRELVINIGANEGVKKSTKFAILAERPVEIRDPDSNDLLDVVDREKVRVVAVEVRDKVTICSTFEKRTVGRAPVIPLIGDMFQDARRQVPVTLRAGAESLPAPLSPEESYVKKGDRVIELDEHQS